MYCVYHKRQTVKWHHIAFFSFLVLLLIASIIMAASQSGPIILGTEMNSNGHVEYLCLGNGCENLSDFYWKD